MIIPILKSRTISTAKVEPYFGSDSINSRGHRLILAPGNARNYRLAQLDDYSSLPRRNFVWFPPISLCLRARLSERDLPGTWGFGFWNDPFGFSLSIGGSAGRFPALPNAVWFFHASPRNHLTFRSDMPGNGFLAQSFHSPAFHPMLLPVALAFPFSPKTSRHLLNQVIAEEDSRLDVDTTQWHEYRLDWNINQVVFWVDDHRVMETPIVPKPPLGMVIWLDNQFAAFMGDGKLRWGLEDNPQSWLEVDQISVCSLK